MRRSSAASAAQHGQNHPADNSRHTATYLPSYQRRAPCPPSLHHSVSPSLLPAPSRPSPSPGFDSVPLSCRLVPVIFRLSFSTRLSGAVSSSCQVPRTSVTGGLSISNRRPSTHVSTTFVCLLNRSPSVTTRFPAMPGAM